MKSSKAILNYMDRRDTYLYREFLNHHNSKDEFHTYNFLASVDEFSIYDGMQLKFDIDGEVKQNFIELKGRYVYISEYKDCAVDLKKIQQLQKLSFNSNIPTYLIGIYYLDSKLCIWKIDEERKYQTKWMWVEESQIDPEKRNKKVWKEMALLPFDEGTICKIPQQITYTALTEFKNIN